ncbi:hypothetical protein D3C84_1126560 [compost metagenome]
MLKIITLIICAQRDNDSDDAKIFQIRLNRPRGLVALHADAVNGHTDWPVDEQVMVIVVAEARFTIIEDISVRSLADLGVDPIRRQQS